MLASFGGEGRGKSLEMMSKPMINMLNMINNFSMTIVSPSKNLIRLLDEKPQWGALMIACMTSPRSCFDHCLRYLDKAAPSTKVCIIHI